MQRTPEVLNRYKASPLMADAVYIGRGSPYGNPFVIDRDDTDYIIEWRQKAPVAVGE